VAGLNYVELAHTTSLATPEFRIRCHVDLGPLARASAVAEAAVREDHRAPLVAAPAVQVGLEYDPDLLARLERNLV
jgi:hypothetical protein